MLHVTLKQDSKCSYLTLSVQTMSDCRDQPLLVQVSTNPYEWKLMYSGSIIEQIQSDDFKEVGFIPVSENLIVIQVQDINDDTIKISVVGDVRSMQDFEQELSDFDVLGAFQILQYTIKQIEIIPLIKSLEYFYVIFI